MNKLDALASKFREELPEKLAPVFSVAQKFDCGAALDIEEMEAARLAAHRIRGTAAWFGLAKLGDLCGDIEDLLLAVLKQKDAPGSIAQQFSARANAISQVLKEHAEPESAAKSISPDTAEQAPDSAAMNSADSTHNQLATVLVVDDDPNFLTMIKSLGAMRLIRIIEATNGYTAIEKLGAEAVDAALIDFDLGTDESSIELLAQMRDLKGYERLPVAFISGRRDMVQRSAALERGAALFLDKPLQPETLEQAVQQLLTLSNTNKPQVLLVEDDYIFAETLTAILRHQQIGVHLIVDGLKLLDALDEHNPDVLLLDIDLPGLNGFELCRIVRGSPRWAELPIILLTANTSWESRINAFRSGADDYLVKPIVEEEILAKVRSRAERNRMLREMMRRDTITGLLVRRAFIESLEVILRDAQNQNKQVCVAMMDIDNFKTVNDRGGHLVGDGALAGLGRLLRRSFRPQDIRGRWGGDEFLIAFPDIDKATAKIALDHTNEAFQLISFYGDNNAPFSLSFSAGVAVFPTEATLAHELVKLADERLYLAKERGRKRVCIE